MYCQGCGLKLSDEANFCSHCGRSVKPGVTEPSPTPVYEICQTNYQYIRLPFFLFIGLADAQAVFVANATCPKKGVYQAGKSPTFSTKTYGCAMGETPSPNFGGPGYAPQQQAAFDALVGDLLAQGWEPVNQSDLFAHVRSFRRIV